MFTLAFDTTVNFCSIVLFNGSQEIARFEKEMDFGQAETLIVKIDEIIKKHNLIFKDLSLVTVCTGPGSFTGVRSSISAARAFKLACPNVNIAGINAFETYIAELKNEEISEINAVIIETKREDFYIQYYDHNLNKIMPPSTAFYEDIIKVLGNKKVTLIGDGVERFLSRPSGLNLHYVKIKQNISIDQLALAGLKKLSNKTIDFPKPLYLKAPDVCVK